MPFFVFQHRKSHNCTSNVILPPNSNIKFNKTTHEDNFCVISFSTPEGEEAELPVWIVSIVFFSSILYILYNFTFQTTLFHAVTREKCKWGRRRSGTCYYFNVLLVPTQNRSNSLEYLHECPSLEKFHFQLFFH